MEEQTAKQGFEQWAILELFGHNVMAGLVSEQTIGGAAFIRIDVPEIDAEHPAFTKFYGGAAVYGISPVTEEIARGAAERMRVRPVTTYMLPQPKPQISERKVIHSMSEEDMRDRLADDDEEDDDLGSTPIPF